MLTIANTYLANTFDHWRNRTNETAYALSTCVVTTDANSGSTPATGNGGITGTFLANNLTITYDISSGNNLSVNSISVNTIAVGTGKVNSSYISVGNTISNAVINTTAFVVQNTSSKAVLPIPDPDLIDQPSGHSSYFLNANNSWVHVPQDVYNGIAIGTGISTLVVDTFSLSPLGDTNFTCAEYLLSVVDQVTPANRYVTKVLVMISYGTGTDGTAYMTEYGGLQLGQASGIGSFSVGITTGTFYLYFTPTVTTTNVYWARVAT